jgi:lipoprotein-releasing system permease protein
MSLTLSFILGVASFNIFFALMMLVIEKQKDIAVLQSMGATGKTIGQIFFLEGALIAFVGAFVGLIAGITICVLQQMYGFIKMGATTMVVSAYPVQLRIEDFFYTIITIVIITLLASLLPALKAANLVGKDYL